MNYLSPRQWFYLAAFLFLLLDAACAQELNQDRNTITIPKPMNDGWQTGSLSEVKIDSTKLSRLLTKITENEYQTIHSILIVKDGKLVFEKYFPGYDFDYNAKDLKGKYIEHDCNTLHNLASVTKSVTSLLLGIAVDKKLVAGVDEKLFSFFPKDSSLFNGSKRNITLRNLLTMNSGIKWNENDVPYTDTTNDVVQLFMVPDPQKYILSKPLADEPGTKFYYNGGGTNLIGRIVQNTSGIMLDSFAQKYLFEPMGISQYKWVYINPNFVYASGDLRLRPRDMAKLGSLVLNKGEWNGKRVISSEWIEQMTTKNVWMPNDEGYGYQWWLKKYKFNSKELNCIQAAGWGEQHIMIFPELNSVIVITAGNYTGKRNVPEIVNRYLLPSLEADFGYDKTEIEKAAPLPDSVKIIKPDIQTNNNTAAFSGIWLGKWDYSLPIQLVVEKTNNNHTEIIYAWSDHPAGYFKKGWMNKTATFDSSGSLKFNTDNASWEFKYISDGDVLIGYYKDQYVNLKAIMNRKK